MLTETQIQNLQEFTTSQKFGKLTEAAIETWKNKANFTFNAFGINYSQHTTYKLDADQKCCLISAALVDKSKSRNEGIYCGVKRLFDLTRSEVEYIWQGFDCDNPNEIRDNEHNESFMFGNKIRQALLTK